MKAGVPNNAGGPILRRGSDGFKFKTKPPGTNLAEELFAVVLDGLGGQECWSPKELRGPASDGFKF